jgi:O-antigen ligase
MTFFLLVPALLLLAVLAATNYGQAILLLAALLPAYLLRFSLFGIPTNFLEAAILIICVVGVGQPPIRQQWKAALSKPSPWVMVWIGLFVAAVLCSTFISPQLRVSLGILKSWVLFPLVFAFIIASWAAASQKTQQVTHYLWLSGVGMAIIGLFQLGHVPRIFSVYDVPNSLALFLAPLLVMSVWTARARHTWHILGVGIMAAALFATQSLAGAVSALLALGIGALLWRRRWILPLAGIIIVAGILFSLTGKMPYLLRPLIDSTVHSSLSVRLQLWSVGWDLVKKHPLSGVGLGQFEPAYQQQLHQRFADYEAGKTVQQPLAEFVYRDPHNVVLSVWLNLGLLGLVSFIAIHYLALKRALSLPSLTRQSIALGLFTLLIFGLTDTIYWKNDLAALQWLLVFMLLFTKKARKSDKLPADGI